MYFHGFTLISFTISSLLCPLGARAGQVSKQPEPGNQLLGNLLPSPLAGRKARISAYYPAYHAKVQSPAQLNYTLYTDLIFFVATTQPNLTLGPGIVPRQDWDPLAFDFVKRCKAALVRPRLAVGGWDGSIFFSDMLSTDLKRKDYAKMLKSYAQKYGFEGIDLDWEFPTQGGIGCNTKRPDDLKNFGSFVSIFKKMWPEGELTAAGSILGVKSSPTTLATSAEMHDLVNSLDYINIMAYDVYGGWSTTTGPNAPFDGKCASEEVSEAASVQNAIEIYSRQGFKSSQIVLGIPGYGHSFALTSPTLKTTNFGGIPSQLYQAKKPGNPPGGATDDPPRIDACGAKAGWGGVWRYRELIEHGFLEKDGRKGSKGYTRHFDQCSATPFLTNATWLLSYDDEQSTIIKTRFARNKALAGLFFFDTQGPTDSVVEAAKSMLKVTKPAEGFFF